MERHYTYLMEYFPGEFGQNLEKLVFAIGLGALLLLLCYWAAARIKSSEERKNYIVPPRRVSFFGVFDVFVDAFAAFHDSLLGKENRRFLPLSGSVFLFIFSANLLGLVPGIPAITTSVWVNVGMALIVFLAFNYYGIREHGVVGYIKHFFGGPQLTHVPLVFIGIVVCVLEMFSTTLRVLTLNLRLYWNITADHIVLASITNLSPITRYGIPVVFYLMGTFVAFMQAFVFTVLTMIYILLATQHGEEH
jgi:F-type H+-transporting ATPase subunit a